MMTMTLLPQSRPLTRADLQAMPDDGHRYELLDGALLVTPAPARRHQRVVANLSHLLMSSCPEQLEVLFAPFDVELAEDTVLQPDLLVTPRTSAEEHGLVGPPLLAVEVLSPSTRLIDLNLKRVRYELAGCASYWVIDPVVGSLIAWTLDEGQYADPVQVEANAPFVTDLPFAVTVVPALLLT